MSAISESTELLMEQIVDGHLDDRSPDGFRIRFFVRIGMLGVVVRRLGNRAPIPNTWCDVIVGRHGLNFSNNVPLKR